MSIQCSPYAIMLTLRNVVCNDRWAQVWPRITAHQHQQARERKAKARKGRGRQQQIAQVQQSQVEGTISSRPKMQAKLAPAALTPNNTNNAENKPKAPWRPAADHPWRRSPIGRARLQTLKAS
jgi:hypothetical protein